MPEIDLETDQILRLLQCLLETEERLNTAHKAVIQHLGDIKNTLRGALTRASAPFVLPPELGHDAQAAGLRTVPAELLPQAGDAVTSQAMAEVEADVAELDASLGIATPGTQRPRHPDAAELDAAEAKTQAELGISQRRPGRR
jgi:hypothetical protein